jgi:hypothetical protein
MFQLLDKSEALKLDLYPREMIPGELDRSEFLEVFEGETYPIVARGDAAVSKLVWTSKGSHKSRHDLRLIYRSATDAVRGQIAQAAAQLELSELLAQVLAESDAIE